jgi:SAM-dependent methyltransferase
MRLNLGCNDDHRAGYVNVDQCPPANQIADLRLAPWPWQDSSVEEILAHDIFEHLPSKIQTMNEAWRVLRPGGRLDLIVPTVAGPGAFQDPPHCSWWTKNDRFYFCGEFPEHARFGRHYGITCNFKIVKWEHRNYCEDSWKVFAILEAIK